MAVENQGSSKGNTDTSDVKLIFPTPGYVKQQHDGLAEKAGDQSRIETAGKEPKVGVAKTPVPKSK